MRDTTNTAAPERVRHRMVRQDRTRDEGFRRDMAGTVRSREDREIQRGGGGFQMSGGGYFESTREKVRNGPKHDEIEMWREVKGWIDREEESRAFKMFLCVFRFYTVFVPERRIEKWAQKVPERGHNRLKGDTG